MTDMNDCLHRITGKLQNAPGGGELTAEYHQPFGYSLWYKTEKLSINIKEYSLGKCLQKLYLLLGTCD